MPNSNKEVILHQHSFLTTFKTKEGKYFTPDVEKINFSLLQGKQNQLGNAYKEKSSNLYKKLKIKDKEIDELTNLAFKNKQMNIDLSNVNMESIKEVSNEILEHEKEKINAISNIDSKEKKKRIDKLTSTNIGKICNSKKDSLSEKEAAELLLDIKDYCKEVAVRECSKSEVIDFTILSKSLGLNITRLKPKVEKAVDTILKFNYIDRKVKGEVTSNLITGVNIYKAENQKNLSMKYQIPEAILELLLMPENYVSLSNLAVKRISGSHTYRLYGLFKEHSLRGWVELSKEEFVNFLNINKSNQGNKAKLEADVLKPALKDVENATGIKATYQLIPSRAWKKIRFTFKKIKDVPMETGTIVSADSKDDYDDNNLIKTEILKTKRNTFVSKSWNKRVDNKLRKIYHMYGEKYTIYILRALYSSLSTDITKTLVVYINGMMKKIKAEDIDSFVLSKEEKEAAKSKEKIVQKTINLETKKNKETEVLEPEVIEEELDPHYETYLNLPKALKEIVEKQAVKLYLKEVNQETLDEKHKVFFEKAKNTLIIKIMQED